MNRTNSISEVLASIRAGVLQQQRRAEGDASRAPPQPFVTVSRQAGAGGRSLARALAEWVNAADPADRPWTVWDRELVEKVSQEQHIPASLVESLETGAARHNAFQDFLASLWEHSGGADLDEFQVFRRVAGAARVLARAGRAILVGRGAVYATADLPGGIHVRLVAPLQSRVTHMAAVLKTSEAEAAREVARIDAFREAFHRRYWPDKALSSEIFTVTFNSGQMTEAQMVQCLLPLIPPTSPVAARSDVAAETAGAMA